MARSVATAATGSAAGSSSSRSSASSLPWRVSSCPRGWPTERPAAIPAARAYGPRRSIALRYTPPRPGSCKHTRLCRPSTAARETQPLSETIGEAVAPEAAPAVAAALPAPSPFSVFRKRDFRLLWSAQLVSTVGTALTDLAAGILVFRVTGSALSVGLMFMAVSVPTLLIGLIAGVFVDRYDRRKIMISAD